MGLMIAASHSTAPWYIAIVIIPLALSDSSPTPRVSTGTAGIVVILSASCPLRRLSCPTDSGVKSWYVAPAAASVRGPLPCRSNRAPWI